MSSVEVFLNDLLKGEAPNEEILNVPPNVPPNDPNGPYEMGEIPNEVPSDDAPNGSLEVFTTITCGGTKQWFRNGKLHRTDGPAHVSGVAREWYLYGELHREDGPAIEMILGNKMMWYWKGKKHRVGAPAIVSPFGEQWYHHDLLHRIGGPAIESQQLKKWYQHGKLHRIDGPAIENDGLYMWYFEGFEVDQKSLERIEARIKRRERQINTFILDRMLPKIYDPRRKSGQRRMLESYLELEIPYDMSQNK